MKCINCGKKTAEGKVICESCTGVGEYIDFLRVHKCGSFSQMKDKSEGVCNNVLFCNPIKKALKKETLIVPRLGHVVCPYSEENLAYILHNTFDKEKLERNYSECFE